MSRTLRLVLAASICFTLASCQVARKRGFHLELTDFDMTTQRLDDVVVWPVQQQGGDLSDELLARMTARLHQGVRDREYSVISRSMVDHLAGQLGTDEQAALAALERTAADGVLVVQLTGWDDQALLRLGQVRAEGQLRLLDAGGQVRWQGRIRCEDVLVDRLTGPKDMDERREIAVERLAELLASRLPRHRV